MGERGGSIEIRGAARARLGRACRHGTRVCLFFKEQWEAITTFKLVRTCSSFLSREDDLGPGVKSGLWGQSLCRGAGWELL